MKHQRIFYFITIFGVFVFAYIILIINYNSDINVIYDDNTALAMISNSYFVNGKEFDTQSEILYFNNEYIPDCSSFIHDITQFENLKIVELCQTNLTYEQLENIRDSLPNIKFVWTITLANTWTIRTDVVAFTTNKFHRNPAIKNDEIWKLKYLTDIVALDLGNNEISDLSFLQYMPNLKILILANNWISDLSPIKSCKNLMYLETFCNPITDITPLTELINLVDVNVSYNYFTDYTPLLNKHQLERLHITHTSLSIDSINALKTAYPGVKIEYTCGTSVQGGWREHPRYFAMRDTFMTNSVNKLFLNNEENY